MRNGTAQHTPPQGQKEQSKQQAEASPAEVRLAAAQDTIEQVRELLFGQEKRRTDQTFNEMRADMERQIEALRTEMRQHVDSLTHHLMDLEKTAETRRLDSIGQIGKAISDLGAAVQNMGAGSGKTRG
jgi:hypothetical protein